MATPTVSASLDKATYASGDKATLTVTYADADNSSTALTVTVTDAEGHTASAKVTLVETDGVTVAVSDSGGRTWAKVSDNGSVAVFTATV